MNPAKTHAGQAVLRGPTGMLRKLKREDDVPTGCYAIPLHSVSGTISQAFGRNAVFWEIGEKRIERMNESSQPSKEHRAAIGPAEEYERVKVPKHFEPVARMFIRHISLQPSDRVLDVACGTGIVARIVAEQEGFAGQITGIDLDPDMLAVARTKMPSSGIVIDWKEGDAQNLPFNSDSFDLVLCQQGLQYFPDKGAALKSMHRVLVSHGRVAILVAASINPKDQPRKWAEMEALRKHVSNEAADKKRHPGYFQGSTDQLKEIVAAAGFQDVGVQALMGFTGSKGTLEQLVNEEQYPELEPEIRNKVVKDIREALRPFDKGSETRLPLGSYIATGYK